MASKMYLAKATQTVDGEEVVNLIKFMHVNVPDNLSDAKAIAMYEKDHAGVKLSDVRPLGSMTQSELNDAMRSIPGFEEIPK